MHELQTRHDSNLKKIFFALWRKRLQKSRVRFFDFLCHAKGDSERHFTVDERESRQIQGSSRCSTGSCSHACLGVQRTRAFIGAGNKCASNSRCLADVEVSRQRPGCSSKYVGNAIQVTSFICTYLAFSKDKALEFAGQTNLIVQHSAMSQWKQALLNRQKLSNLAQQYYDEHLQSRMLTFWRIRLRQYIRTIKQARVARRYLVMRKSWDKWVETMRVKTIQKKAMRKYFDGMTPTLPILTSFNLTSKTTVWRAAAARAQYHRFAQKKVEALVNQVSTITMVSYSY